MSLVAYPSRRAHELVVPTAHGGSRRGSWTSSGPRWTPTSAEAHSVAAAAPRAPSAIYRDVVDGFWVIAEVVRAYSRSSPCLAARRRPHTEAAAPLCRSSSRHCRPSGSSSSMILLDTEHSDLTAGTVHSTLLTPRACQRAARGRVSWSPEAIYVTSEALGPR